MAWPEFPLPLESDGESVLDELELDELDELLEDDEPVVEVLLELLDEAACAATPTASVPATLAATSAPVIAAVRRSPVSRSMIAFPHSLTTQRTLPHHIFLGLCRS